jgi:hypothetical protein
MDRIYKFLRAVFDHWGSLVTSGVFIGALAIWQGTGHAVKPVVYWIVAVAGLLIAVFKAWQEQLGEKEKALAEIGRLQNELAQKPNIEGQFDYNKREATLAVTNTGTIADVWAAIRVDGAVTGRRVDIFAKWGHSNTVKARIAKGETCRLLLAILDGDTRIANWKIPYVLDTGVGITQAYYSSLLSGTEAQADDLHLHVNLFTDPDRERLTNEFHIVLHARSAEQVGD